MAEQISYKEAKATGRLVFKVCRVLMNLKSNNGYGYYTRSAVYDQPKTYEAVCYENQLFEGTPEGKHDYYARCSSGDTAKIEHIFKEKDQIFGFWGTVVTDEPIDFIFPNKNNKGDIIEYNGEPCVVDSVVAEIEYVSYIPM